MTEWMSSVDRIPPNNLEAEMALLGAIIVDREQYAIAAGIVQPDDFYASLHETVYRALAALYDRNDPVDKVSLAEELKTRGMLDKVGGIAYLSSIMDAVSSTAATEYYARIVREKAALRGLIGAGTRVTQLGYEGEDDASAALLAAEESVRAITRAGISTSFESTEHAIESVFELIGSYRHNGVTSGFPEIDRMTGCFHGGQFIVIGARPAMGKTALGLQIASAAAKASGKAVAVHSLEMTTPELMFRLLCSEARIDASHLKADEIEPELWDRLSYGMGQVPRIPLYVDDNAGLDVNEIRSRLRRLAATQGLGAVLIDYLQLVRSGERRSKNDELTEISRTLKETAKELDVPIIALAQLNRQVEVRPDKRPMLADLRESGAIEQEADLVAFLYREGYYEPECDEPNKTEFIIAKQRAGKVGTVNLQFMPEHTMFVPYAAEEQFSR